MPTTVSAKKTDTSKMGGEFIRIAQLNEGLHTFKVVGPDYTHYDKDESKFGRESWGFRTPTDEVLMVSSAVLAKAIIEGLKKKNRITVKVRLTGEAGQSDRRYKDIRVS